MMAFKILGLFKMDYPPNNSVEGTAHKLRLWVPYAASPLRRPLTSNVKKQKPGHTAPVFISAWKRKAS